MGNKKLDFIYKKNVKSFGKKEKDMPVKKSVKKTPARRANSTKNYKMVSFGCAISNFFKKYFQFSGVSTRAEYWWATLFVVLVFFCLHALECGTMYSIVKYFIT